MPAFKRGAVGVYWCSEGGLSRFVARADRPSGYPARSGLHPPRFGPARWLHVQVSAAASSSCSSLPGGTGAQPQKWIAGPKRTIVYRSAFDPEWTNPAGPSDVAKLDIVEELRSARRSRRGHDFNVDETQCRISFVAPGYSAKALVDRRSGAYELTVVAEASSARERPPRGTRGGLSGRSQSIWPPSC